MNFEEVMNFHADNPVIYNKIKQHLVNKTLIPFIGAGLSAFVYPMWIPFLKDLAYKNINNENKKNYVFELLKESKCEEAAEIICNEMGEFRFNAYLSEIFSAHKIEDKKLMEQSVYLIPILFKTLILTTNFDLVIERAFFLNNMILNVYYPSNKKAFLNALRRNSNTALFKIHGDVNSDKSSLIITETAYETNYKKKSQLVNELSILMKAKPILFLGCSLHQDRTMKLLKDIVEDGIENYAIVSCKEGKQTERAKELSSKQILSILYPPDSNHTALKIILEHLAIDLAEPSYFAGYYSRKECLDNILKIQLRSHVKKHLVFFGGVSSRLSEMNDIDELNNWLLKSKIHHVFFCYEKGEGAQSRAKNINKNSIEIDRLPHDPLERMKYKAKRLEESILLYSPEVREQIHLIPLSSALTTYPIVVDEQIYFNVLTSEKNLKSTTVKLMENRIGNKIKNDLLDYMIYELSRLSQEIKSNEVNMLIGILKDIKK